jgi:hypothetical protein
MRNVDLAYIAGLVDADGTITLSTRNTKGSTRVNFEIASNKPECLYWCLAVTDMGHVYKKNTKYGPTYSWNVFAKQLRQLLPAILPYLITKRYQAEKMLEYFEMVDRVKNTKDGYRKAAVSRIIEQMQHANKVRSLEQVSCGV